MVGYVSKGSAKINCLMLNIIIKGTFILKGRVTNFITKLKNSLKSKKLLTVILYHQWYKNNDYIEKSEYFTVFNLNSM